jgi:hypothetical protein
MASMTPHRITALWRGFLLAVPVMGRASVMDSIKGFFSGGVSSLFGGGGGGSEAQLTKLIGQVQGAQKQFADAQTAVAGTYNGPASNIKPDDAALQSKLEQMAKTSQATDKLYLQLLQVQADLEKNGKKEDLATFKDQLAKVTETQTKLESNYQKIVEVNRKKGFFKPTEKKSEVASAPTETSEDEEKASETDTKEEPSPAPASPAPRWAGGRFWERPDVDSYIDEWLAKCHLNQRGQWEGSSATATVRGAGSMSSGQGHNRYEVLWATLQHDKAHSNMTLGQYVRARLRGDKPEIVYQPPAELTEVSGGATQGPAQEATPQAKADEGTAAEEAGNKPTATSEDKASDIAGVNSALNNRYEHLIQLQKTGKGDSAEAKELLKKIQGLQERRSAIAGKH